MNKNITLENVIKLYDEDKSADKKNFFSQIKVEDYIPYLTKVEIANRIVEATCVKDGFVKMDSPTKYMIYCRSIIDLYTNIKFAEKADENEDDNTLGLLMVAEFDALNSRGLFEKIFSKISDKELTEFNTVLDMVSGDLMTNKYEPHSYFNDLLSRLSDVLTTFSNTFDKVDIDNLSKIIEVVNEQ